MTDYRVDEVFQANITVIKSQLGLENNEQVLVKAITMLRFLADAKTRGDKIMIGNQELIL